MSSYGTLVIGCLPMTDNIKDNIPSTMVMWNLYFTSPALGLGTLL